MSIKPIAIFDIDNTLIKGQSQLLFVRYLYTEGKLSCLKYFKVLLWFVLYKIGIYEDVSKIRRKLFVELKDFQIKEWEKIIHEFFYKEITRRILPKSIELINYHKQSNFEIIIISATISQIADMFRKYLSLDFQMSTKLEKKGELLTGKIEGDIVYGRNKVNKLMEFIRNNNLSLKGSFAYGDHISDVPLLTFVENPIVVNPNKKMKKMAEKNNWRIICTF